jgi:microcystin-dependent protein
MDPFVAEIRIFPFNFAPKGWAFCNGQLLPLSQNTALFSLLGTNYGGDGKSNFALPNLQGSAPMHPSDGSNGTMQHFLGETGGSDVVTLISTEIPVHTHTLGTTNQVGEDRTPPAEILSKAVGGNLYGNTTNLVTMHVQALPPAGGSLPHNNLMPYLTFNFNIALQGVFPARP